MFFIFFYLLKKVVRKRERTKQNVTLCDLFINLGEFDTTVPQESFTTR